MRAAADRQTRAMLVRRHGSHRGSRRREAAVSRAKADGQTNTGLITQAEGEVSTEQLYE